MFTQTESNKSDDARSTDSNRPQPAIAPGLMAVMFTGAIFGFFYAWVCSTMWGLDNADPRVAIAAMQAMNGSVRNATFAPAFFGTPFVLGAAALVARRDGCRGAVRWFALAAGIYVLGGMILTMAVNVPMNEDLAAVVIPDSIGAAELIWNDYSGTWQVWNIARTIFSGISLGLASMGLASVARRPAQG